MTRYDSKHSGITEIVHDDGTDRWLVVRRRLSKAKQVRIVFTVCWPHTLTVLTPRLSGMMSSL